jgi:uroporphyrinogen-III synthase
MKRVLLLKSRAACEPLSFLLEEEGLEPLHLPLLEVTWPEDPRGLRAAAEGIGRFRWIAADAPQAVRVLAEAIASAGSARALFSVQWLAPDEATARAISRHGWIPRVVQAPEDDGCGHGAHLHAHPHAPWGALVQSVLSDDDVLVVHEAGAEPGWVELLREARGQVVCVGAWVRGAPPSLEAAPDAIVVDSPTAAEALLERHLGLRDAPLVAVGPATAQALKALGASQVILAASPGTEAVFDAALVALK